MTDRDNYQRVGVEVDQQSFNQLKGATDSILNELNALQNITGRTTDSIARLNEVSNLLGREQTIQNVGRQYAQLGKIIGDDTDALRQMRVALKEVGASGEEISRATHAFQEFKDESSGGGSKFGVEGLRRTGGAINQLLPDSDIGPAIQRLGDLGQVVKEAGVAGEAANISISATSVAIGGLEVATGPLVVVLGAAAALVGAVAIYQKNYNDQLKAGQDLLNSALDAQREYYTDVNTLSTEQAKERLKILKGQQQTEKDIAAENQNAIINLAKQVYEGRAQEYVGTLNPDDAIKYIRSISDTDERFKQLFAAMDKSKISFDKFDLSTTRIQQGLDKGSFAANDAAVGLAAVGGELKDLGAAKAAEELKNLNSEVQAAQKDAQERAQKQVAAVEKYNAAVQSAEDAAGEARVNAANKLNDSLVAAAQKLVDDANKALETLNQKRADNLTSLQRDEDKSQRESQDKLYEGQVKAQRQERDDLEQHLQRIKDIRDQDKSRERDDLLNRNYRDLFALGEQKKEQISAENDKFNEQEQQRKQAFQDEQNDETRAIQVQRRERLIAYNQANTDAFKQYGIELAHAQEAKTRSIQLAQQGYQKELNLISRSIIDKQNLLRQGYLNELKLATQTVQARQAIFQAELNQALHDQGISTAPRFNSPQAISSASAYAEGGLTSAYKPIKVNDRDGQRESFNGALLPRGMGLFIPMQSGSINPGSGGSTGPSFSQTNYITGPDPKTIASMIDQRTISLLKRANK